MKGMGEKSLQNIRPESTSFAKGRPRPAGRGSAVASQLVERMKERCALGGIEPAGSLRRMKETIGDIDILATLPTAGSPAEAKQVIQTLLRCRASPRSLPPEVPRAPYAPKRAFKSTYGR